MSTPQQIMCRMIKEVRLMFTARHEKKNPGFVKHEFGWLKWPISTQDLCDLYRSERYKLTEIAVLLDPSYTTDQIEECRGILRVHIPDGNVQSASVFPRRGIIIDSVNSFLGLDTPLCVCILPHTHKTKSTSHQKMVNIFKKEKTEPCEGINDPRFRVFLASRATHKAVFVVPEMDAETVKQFKFDYFKVGVCYDFTLVIEYGSMSYCSNNDTFRSKVQ